MIHSNSSRRELIRIDIKLPDCVLRHKIKKSLGFSTEQFFGITTKTSSYRSVRRKTMLSRHLFVVYERASMKAARWRMVESLIDWKDNSVFMFGKNAGCCYKKVCFSWSPLGWRTFNWNGCQGGRGLVGGVFSLPCMNQMNELNLAFEGYFLNSTNIWTV